MRKRVLVTGGGKGIGKAISEKLAQNNWEVLLCGRDLSVLDQSKSELSNPGIHRSIECDLRNPNEISELVNNVEKLDALVLNAGILSTKPIKFIKYQDTLDLFSVNVLANIQLVNDLEKQKKLNREASVVVISSMVTSKALKGNAVYTSSKAALNGFSKVAALELAKKKIRLNIVKPGFIETNLTSGLRPDEAGMTEHLKNYPLGRFGKGEDVANLVAFLLSDEARWITGAEINVDGGYGLT